MNKLERLGLSPLQRLFVAAFDGDVEATASRVNLPIETARSWARASWFSEALKARSEREATRASNARNAALREAVADRTEIQAMWSEVMRGQRLPVVDPDTGLPELDDHGAPMFSGEPSMRDRLNAAKLLADSLGMNVQTVVLEGGDKPVLVKHVEIEERLALLSSVRRITAHQPSADWLS